MIRLLNIKRIGNIIECDYIPEDAEISTPIEYDVQSEHSSNFQILKVMSIVAVFLLRFLIILETILIICLKTPLLCGAKTSKALCIYIKRKFRTLHKRLCGVFYCRR